MRPSDIVDHEDFHKVPLLTRDDIKENFEQLISEEASPKHLKISTTGGTTGEPVKVMFDKRVPLESMGWRMYSWWGLKPGLNSALIWRDIRTRLVSRVINQAMWWPALRITLDASSMSIQDVEKFIKLFNKIQPRILHGYVGSVDYIAGIIEQKGYKIAPPKAISVTSSPMTSVQRKRIESAFRAPVYDQYGSCEVFWLSSQCGAKRDLHIYHDTRFIEFVDDAGKPVPKNELGNVVVTDLENYYFPLIRYVNGDKSRALPGKCPCGINLPLMDKVRGRTTDLVKLPNGICLSGDYLTTLFDRFPDAVKGFQVRQKKDYSIQLIYIPSSDTETLSRALKIIKNELMEKLDSQVEITLKPVKNIAHDRGKLRFVISEVE
ncbi:MAG: phenylacetate--CoA ligase family protein [Planctomycetota bacterium]